LERPGSQRTGGHEDLAFFSLGFGHQDLAQSLSDGLEATTNLHKLLEAHHNLGSSSSDSYPSRRPQSPREISAMKNLERTQKL